MALQVACKRRLISFNPAVDGISVPTVKRKAVEPTTTPNEIARITPQLIIEKVPRIAATGLGMNSRSKLLDKRVDQRADRGGRQRTIWPELILIDFPLIVRLKRPGARAD